MEKFKERIEECNKVAYILGVKALGEATSSLLCGNLYFNSPNNKQNCDLGEWLKIVLVTNSGASQSCF